MITGEDEVWVSNIRFHSEYATYRGIRTRHQGYGWDQAFDDTCDAPDDHWQRVKRCLAGETLREDEFPIATCVVDEKRFLKTKQYFYINGFLAFREKLAAVLRPFNFGAGGLVDHPILYDDLVTPYPAKVVLLNFGGAKDTFLYEHSRKDVFEHPIIRKSDGFHKWLWRDCPEDGDIAVSAQALEGVDIWIEPHTPKQIYMRGTMARALRKARVGVNFHMTRCKIVPMDDVSHQI